MGHCTGNASARRRESAHPRPWSPPRPLERRGKRSWRKQKYAASPARVARNLEMTETVASRSREWNSENGLSLHPKALPTS